VERVPVASTTLRSVGYEAGTLEVEFESGSVYQYFDVSESIYDELLRAASPGTFFNEQIRGHLRYART
jgi:hypothetical protein